MTLDMNTARTGWNTLRPESLKPGISLLDAATYDLIDAPEELPRGGLMSREPLPDVQIVYGEVMRLQWWM